MRVPLIDLSRQQDQIADDVAEKIGGVIEATDFIQGEAVAEFEEQFARFCGVEHCIGVGSGTDALEFAVRALGIGPGSEVVVPANSFIASALAVLRAGADVVLVDCKPETHLVDVDQLVQSVGPRTRAVMPVHLYGQMAPVEQIREAIGGIPIIEDAAQSHGASRNGKFAGSLGTVAGTSFYPGKNIGAYGDAGAVLTDDEYLAASVRRLGNWGSSRKYHHPVKGFNSRLDTIQAVVLSAKLKRLQTWNQQRAEAAQAYDNLLKGSEVVVPPTTLTGNHHVWHLYVVRVPNRDRVLEELRNRGVEAGVHYPIPMHLQGALADLGHVEGDFPITEKAAQEILSLPIFPGITHSEQEYVVECLISAVSRTDASIG